MQKKEFYYGHYSVLKQCTQASCNKEEDGIQRENELKCDFFYLFLNYLLWVKNDRQMQKPSRR